MNRIKGKGRYFILGVIFTLVLTTVGVASGGLSNIKVRLNNIKVIVDGKDLGADNILYKGTTYVPIRKAAESLGRKVSFDKKTNTATISSSNGESVNPPVSEKISLKKAMEIYEKEYPNAKITEAKYKYVSSDRIYEIDGLDLKGEYDLDISSEGKILKRDIDRPDSDARYEMEYEGFNSKDITGLATTEEAEKIAMDKAKSIFKSNARIKSVEFEKENGVYVYDIELDFDNGKDIDIKINAKTKNIIKMDD